MKPVLVIGCHIMGLAAVRALRQHRIPSVAMHYESADIAQVSRYPMAHERIPNPEEDEGRFVRYLEDAADRWPGALLMPCNDPVAVAVSKHHEQLSRHYPIGIPSWESVQPFIEKSLTYPLAESCGVPCPISRACEADIPIPVLAEGMDFPAILKPVRSDAFKRRFHVKNFRVTQLDELADKLRVCRQAGLDMLLQEIIPGDDDEIRKIQAYANSQGRLVGRFFLRKVRSNPPPFGVGRVNLSCARDPEVERLAQQLIEAAGFRGGVISVEFKRDRRDGQLKLMENNTRITRNNLLSTSCGINFPWLMYEDLMEDRQVDVTEYREGVYWIDCCPDLYHALFHSRREPDTLRDYLRPYTHRQKVFAVASLRDPRPFLKQTMRWPKQLVKQPRKSSRKPVKQLAKQP